MPIPKESHRWCDEDREVTINIVERCLDEGGGIDTYALTLLAEPERSEAAFVAKRAVSGHD